MKRIIAILMAFVLIFSITALAAEEEFSNSANIDYGYDESYDETEKPEDVTSGRSDDVNPSYDEDYDERFHLTSMFHRQIISHCLLMIIVL